MNLNPVKGMRDFYPPEMARQNWLFDMFRKTADRFNFRAYDACLVEHEELYIRKAGDEITGQLYNFEDKGGRRLSLRPELTPSLARMVISGARNYPMPLKWYSIAQCFRYEKMQKGRKREHYQWNMDIVGDDSRNAELELFAALHFFFSQAGLTPADVQLRFNNRKVLQEVFVQAGLPSDRFDEVSVIIDKRDKIGEDACRAMLVDAGIDSIVSDKIIDFIGVDSIDGIEKKAGFRPDSLSEVDALIEGARAYGMEDFIVFSPSIIRGLSYYTGTVFEVFSLGSASRAICGGGRYDSLIETFGGKPTPMVGFGFGDVVISDILAEKGLFPDTARNKTVMMVSFSNMEDAEAARAAMVLRRAGINVELDLSHRKLKKLFAKADKEGYSHIIIAAPDELQNGNLKVKDMKTGEESAVPARDIAGYVG